MINELTPDIVRAFFKNNQGMDISVRQIQSSEGLDIGTASNKSKLGVHLHRMVLAGELKRIKFGVYRMPTRFEGNRWWEVNPENVFDLSYPYSYEDTSTFGFEDSLELYPGDVWVIGGYGNSGKTALTLNILSENMEKHRCLLMGNEYASMGGKPSPRFISRLNRLPNEWIADDKPKFDMLPVREHYEDYIDGEHDIYLIDWINLTDKFWEIGRIIEDIKTQLGKGVAIIVLQKNKTSDVGRGGDFSKDLADFYTTIDPMGIHARLTVQKAKSPKNNAFLDGRMWAFTVIEKGSRIHNIREIKKCRYCGTRGTVRNGDVCNNCGGLGYEDK